MKFQGSAHNTFFSYAARTNDFQTVSILLVVGGCMKHSPIFKDPNNLCIKMEDFASKNMYVPIIKLKQ